MGTSNCLLGIYNNMLATGELERHWHHILFEMLPTHGDLSKAGIWRPIELLDITCKVFCKDDPQQIGCSL